MKKHYECTNTACSLGSAKSAGLFTGGMTKEQRTVLTGEIDPPKEDYGPGICPNCGKAGKEIEPQGDPREVSS